eukprot:Gb_22643 [translate_table: standard]
MVAEVKGKECFRKENLTRTSRTECCSPQPRERERERESDRSGSNFETLAAIFDFKSNRKSVETDSQVWRFRLVDVTQSSLCYEDAGGKPVADKPRLGWDPMLLPSTPHLNLNVRNWRASQGILISSARKTRRVFLWRRSSDGNGTPALTTQSNHIPSYQIFAPPSPMDLLPSPPTPPFKPVSTAWDTTCVLSAMVRESSFLNIQQSAHLLTKVLTGGHKSPNLSLTG